MLFLKEYQRFLCFFVFSFLFEVGIGADVVCFVSSVLFFLLFLLRFCI